MTLRLLTLFFTLYTLHSTLCPASAQDRLIGSVAWPASKAGLYDIDPASKKLTKRLLDEEMFTIQPGGAFGQSGVRRDNLYYATNFFTEGTTIRVYHAVYDLNTNKRVWIKRDGMLAAAPMDMTYCDLDGKTYGCFHHPVGLGEAYVFGTLNLETWTVTEIRTIATKWLTIAAGPDGYLYVIDEEGSLLQVNRTEGTTRRIATAGVQPYYESSACVSADGERMYVAVTDMMGGTSLATLSLKDGKLLDEITFANGEELLGLTLAPADPAAEAPAMATNFQVPPCPTTTVEMTYHTPTSFYNGDPMAPGTRLTAVVSVDGVEQSRATHTAGDDGKQTVTVKYSGYHTFTLRIESGDGLSSAPVSVRRWVGKDTPTAPQNVKFTRTGTTNTLTWDAVTTSVNEGYLDPAAITYSVYRFPGGDLVGGSLTSPSFTEEMEEPESLATVYYQVEAVVGGSGSRSARGESNHMNFSCIVPPYTQPFETPAVLDAYTILDLNRDGESWHWYDYGGGSMRIFGSQDMDLNDWLITPPIRLEAGKYYEFSVNLHGFKRAYTEFFELSLGRDNTAAAMNIALLPRTQLSSDSPTKYTVGYLVPESGEYFFGVHAVSPAGTTYIYADDISVSEGKAPLMPAQVTDLTLTRAPKSHIAVDVAFTLPTQTVGGEPLTEITRLVVTRDGYTTVMDRTDVKPGERIEFTDKPGSTNFRRYSVVVYNAAGPSAPAEAMEYVGPYSPAQPTDFVVRRTANDGEVHMTWKAPTEDKYGNELDPELVSYTIAGMVNGSPAYLREWYHDTQFTYQAQEPGKPQAFVNFALYAQVDGGSSEKLESTPCPVGAPYAMPSVESFAGGAMTTIFSPEDVFGVSSWDTATDETLGHITSSDGDNGFVYAVSARTGNTSCLHSGIIHVTGAAPILEFKYWSHGSQDKATTTLNILIDGEPAELDGNVFAHAAPAEGWQTATLSLAAFAGKDIQLQFFAQFGTELTVAYDNLRLMEDITRNLSLADVEMPAQSQAGRPLTIKATVQNNGKEDVAGSAYATVLMRDGTEVQRRAGFGTLRMGKSATVTFTDNLTVFDEGAHIYKVYVDYADDEKTDDNESGEMPLQCIVPNYPVPTSLHAIRIDEQQLRLAWGMPQEPADAPTVTDGFEDYEAWAQTGVGDWTLIDGDQLVSGSIGGCEMPGVGGTFFAYTVVNSQKQPKIQSHAGNQCMLSIFAKGGANDEWLISPALSGHSQTISFYARSGTAVYPETFVLMTTDGEAEETEFYKELEWVEKVPSKWTQYTFDLPEGTSHFAIRCVSEDAYYFTVDDVTYTSDEYSVVGLVGYNLYRDGVKVNDEPIEALDITELNDLSAATDYDLTAVYLRGESRPVHLHVTLDGIRIVGAAANGSAAYDLSGRRVAAPKGLLISNGKKITIK